MTFEEKLKAYVEQYKGNFDEFKKSDEYQKIPKGRRADFESNFKTIATKAGTSDNIARAIDSGSSTDKGEKSIADNPDVLAGVRAVDAAKLQPRSSATTMNVLEAEKKLKDLTDEGKGKSKEEKKDIAFKYFPLRSSEKKGEAEKKDLGGLPKKNIIPAFSDLSAEIEERRTNKEKEEKSNSFLKSWAETHPTWGKILKSKDLSWGQKVALVGGALAQLGANVTLGMQSGFNRSAFTPVDWDFRKAINKYTGQEIENVLGAEQSAKGKKANQDFLYNMAMEYGEEKMQEMSKILDAYGDNPSQLKSRLEALGIKEDANEIKKAYANREKITAQEQAKRERLDTKLKDGLVKLQQIDTQIRELERNGIAVDTEVKEAVSNGLIEATNAQNEFQKVKYRSDSDTYELEKYAGYVGNVLNTVSKVASPIIGAMSVQDGIIRSRGMPQKLVRADGTQILLSPDDNIYATKNDISANKDDGKDITHLAQNDEITVQRRLGYEGTPIIKDFNYYLNKLRR